MIGDDVVEDLARAQAINEVVALLEREAEKCVDRGTLEGRDLIDVLKAKVKALLAPHQPADPQHDCSAE